MSPKIVIAGVFSRELDEKVCQRPDDEYIVMVNMGDESVDVRGWSVTNLKRDRLHHYRYLFPRFLSNGDTWKLEPGGLVLIYTARGTNGRTATPGQVHQLHFFQHRMMQIWRDPGDVVCLHNRNGELQAWLELPGLPRTASS